MILNDPMITCRIWIFFFLRFLFIYYYYYCIFYHHLFIVWSVNFIFNFIINLFGLLFCHLTDIFFLSFNYFKERKQANNIKINLNYVYFLQIINMKSKESHYQVFLTELIVTKTKKKKIYISDIYCIYIFFKK